MKETITEKGIHRDSPESDASLSLDPDDDFESLELKGALNRFSNSR